MKVLLTYFEPFRGIAGNSSALAVAALPEELCGARLVKLRLPVSFDDAPGALLDAIARESPEVVVCCGQAAGSETLRFEKIGVNCVNTADLSLRGGALCDAPIDEGGPDGIFSNLPVAEMAAAARGAGARAEVSYSAGTYVCNCVLYTLMRRVREQGAPYYGGFIHIPLLEGQEAPAELPCMETECAVKGLAAGLEAALRRITEAGHD